jgi:DNA (cytosine-5)-methyltransferase 1
LHPYKARRLSVAETLAIQSLPKTFELPSDIPLSAKFKTIGNGVPFVAARGVAKTLKKFLEEL